LLQAGSILGFEHIIDIDMKEQQTGVRCVA